MYYYYTEKIEIFVGGEEKNKKGKRGMGVFKIVKFEYILEGVGGHKNIIIY